MAYRVEKETLAEYAAYINQKERGLAPPHIFALPSWIKAWWSVFGAGNSEMVFSLWEEKRLIGLAPLMAHDGQAFLIGNPDLCDYLDFVIMPGMERAFFSALLPRLKAEGLQGLVLHAQRPEAAVFSGLFGRKEEETHGAVNLWRENCSYELAVPGNWDQYLEGLNKKQRHEVRRKLRRFEEKAVSPRWTIFDEPGEIMENFPLFLELFLKNPVKDDFYTDHIDAFFHTLAAETSAAGICRLGLLETDGIPAAAIFYFDYRGRIYLYNSGYEPLLKDLSVGFVSKARAIETAITGDYEVFDFLKGREVYKHRLGGKAIPVYRVEIKL